MQQCRIIITYLFALIMKKSHKRDQILSIFENGDLLTAHEITKKLPEIDRATIYRNIALFVKLGVLREVNVKKGVSSYEINKEHDHHQHFICGNCEKVIPIEINPDDIRKIIPMGLNVNNFELNLRGSCHDCI